MTQWCYYHLWRRTLWTEMTAGSPSLKMKEFFKVRWSTTELNRNIHSDDNSNNYKWRKYITKKILQNHGLIIDGSMLYNIKNYKFCLWHHISKLNKKYIHWRYIHVSMIRRRRFHYLLRSAPLKNVLLKFKELNPSITGCINLSKPRDHEIMTSLPLEEGFPYGLLSRYSCLQNLMPIAPPKFDI